MTILTTGRLALEEGHRVELGHVLGSTAPQIEAWAYGHFGFGRAGMASRIKPACLEAYTKPSRDRGLLRFAGKDLLGSGSVGALRFGARLRCMKMVGTQDRSEIEPDPQVAWQRCKRLDAMLRTAHAPHLRGAWRLTHEQMNRLDLERRLAQAAKVNQISD